MNQQPAGVAPKAWAFVLGILIMLISVTVFGSPVARWVGAVIGALLIVYSSSDMTQLPDGKKSRELITMNRPAAGRTKGPTRPADCAPDRPSLSFP
jgi:hypothetical protein